tara:strand:- start:1657 stop:2574 length:918 start_codon:yes stop_codon:yes gene_type:complete
MKNKKICIIGYGSHIKKTIIPSLSIKSKNIKIVTKKKLNDFETFSNIQLALKKLSKDYIFFNSTPPKFHYSVSKLVLLSGFNIIIEKPICLSVSQFRELRNIAVKKKLIMFENMMYFYSKQFQLLKKILNKKNIDEVNINFSIPSFNRKSFRKKNNLSSSILFDIGCYPFSLISYFGFNNKIYTIDYELKRNKLSSINIFFISKKIKFNILIAIYKPYKNFVKIIFKNNIVYHLNHFFYGKKIKKYNYMYDINKKMKIYKIDEKNLFSEIFNYSNQKLLKLSKNQYFIIKKYLISLNQIKKKIRL